MSEQIRLIKDEPTANMMDDAEKAIYRELLRQKLQDPEFRQIEGFPLGEDEDILALSDPPYYTACPKPFLPEIIERWQAERAELRQKLGLPDDDPRNGYHREPFAADVSEGKNDPIYNAHSYHTKVPHKAIMRYILHYTDPGDIVFDGFCGTGMTGLAAQLCGDRQAVAELGYIINDQGLIYDGEKPISRLGTRQAVLSDLSPAATFIAYNYNTPVDTAAFEREAQRILREVEEELGWMYETLHVDGITKGIIHYTICSDIFVCPECNHDFIYWNVAVNEKEGMVLDEFLCPSCNASVKKRDIFRSVETIFDHTLQRTILKGKRVPIIVNYSIGKKRYEKRANKQDIELFNRLEAQTVPYNYPSHRMIDGDESRRNDDMGITHVHHFFTGRNLHALSALWSRIDSRHRFLFSALLQRSSLLVMTVMSNYFKKVKGNPIGGYAGKPMVGTLYVPSISTEVSVFQQFSSRISSITKALRQLNIGNSFAIIGTSSSAKLAIPENSVDYIFVDPPFGANIWYSELNYLWESWLRVQTNNGDEAVVNKTQRKQLFEYAEIMRRCFLEFYRILKDGCWMTVEFHNTRNSVWNAIQEAILRSGFVVADVRTLDKKQGSFKQVTSSGTTKQDLIISAYKPHADFEIRFLEEAGTEEGAWEFIRQHLTQLPIVVTKEGVIETLSERQDYLLFDRMVAFHIQRAASVPLSASQFYAGLRQRFVERDSMFFLSEQVPEYDKARLQAQEVAQLTLFVTDEKSTIQWLRQQLTRDFGGHPQTYQDIQPKFLRQLHQLKHEALPELSDMLEQNFLQDERGRWYVPDPNKATDLEKLRQKALLREFNAYLSDKKRLRQFRTEAVRAGFAHAWNQKEYATIVQVAERLPETVLQEDPDLLMYYDNATLLT